MAAAHASGAGQGRWLVTVDPDTGEEWRCLSLSRPWPWLILRMGKRIENRRQKWSYRGRVLLHGARSNDYAGAWKHVVEHADAIGPIRTGTSQVPGLPGTTVTAEVFAPAFFRMQLPGVFDQLVGVVFATARIVDCVGPSEHQSGALGMPYPGRSPEVRAQCLAWHMRGQYGLVLEDVKSTPLVRARGALGLWHPTPDVLVSALGRLS